jgi:glycosyltransferase involved in cell wall biosynthesis
LLEPEGFSFNVQSLSDEAYLEVLYKNARSSLPRIGSLYLRRLLALLSAYRYDLIWIEKEIFPYFPAWGEQFLNLVGKPYIVDYDDAIFHNYDRSPNPIIRRLLGRKIDAVMRNARCVITGNEYLANRALESGAVKVRIIPTVVDTSRYFVKEDRSSECPVIGWIGSPSTEKYVVGIRDALVQACRSHRARLLLVGATPNITNQFPGVDVEVMTWSEDAEAQLVQSMDVGIMPLEDGPWERGKCGYKLIQYMACGVPVIASPVGSNREIVSRSQAGLLAETTEEWNGALQRLLGSSETRKVFGIRGRKAVESNYALNRQAPVLKKILDEALT